LSISGHFCLRHYLSRPHVHTPALLRTHSAQLFDWIARGDLKVRIGGIYPLAEAARAHADMEGRTTTGKLLLIP
jgi:NADPH2:quinone reductase